MNARRRLAVERRLAGNTLSATSAEVGLSAPTIIAAVKAYRAGGWAAVDVKPRGRPRPRTTDEEPQDSAVREALLRAARLEAHSRPGLWDLPRVRQWMASEQGMNVSPSTVANRLVRWNLQPESRYRLLRNRCVSGRMAAGADVIRATGDDENWRPIHERFVRRARRRGDSVYWLSSRRLDDGSNLDQLYAHDLRGTASWCLVGAPADSDAYLAFVERLRIGHRKGGSSEAKDPLALETQERGPGLALVLPSDQLLRATELQSWLDDHDIETLVVPDPTDASAVRPVAGDRNTRANTPGNRLRDRPRNTRENPPRNRPASTPPAGTRIQHTSISNAHQETPVSTSPTSSESVESTGPSGTVEQRPMTHLERLEAESIHIMREVAAEAENPVMLYSVGKDSAVMLHLARKAFYPSVPPFPLMHVDTTWKFKAMYEFRDRMASETGMELITHINQDGVAQGVNPFTHGSALHTDIMKTESLKQALDKHRFDIAFGGARRDEEKSRAKERVFSFRTAQHRWEPKSQRPELWDLYNTRKRQGESIRVFPISNWTELDIWQYIHKEDIPIVPLYFAAERPVVERDGMLIMVDDDRMPMRDGEVPQMRRVRFRTLGCYPLTGAVESKADTLTEIIQEMLLTKTSERQGRMIDHDASASMEKKKQEGYF